MVDDAAHRQRHAERRKGGDDEGEERQDDRRAIGHEQRQEAPERLQALSGRPDRTGGIIFG